MTSSSSIFMGSFSSFSSSSSSCSTSSGVNTRFIQNSLSRGKYSIKTLCFNKKLLSMPSNDEYSVLLCNGLGARKWVVSFDLDAERFKMAIFKVYPLLSTVSGYTLWTINKNKEFEKLPPKVNTPKRISAYFGSHFSGCLIIMPLETIQLISSESLHPEIVRSRGNSDETLSDGINSCQIASQGVRSVRRHQKFCCICGKTSKVADDENYPFYDVDSTILTNGEDSSPLSSILKKVLNIDLTKIVSMPNDSVCKKCFHQLSEIDYLTLQLKNKKEEIIADFFMTASKFSKCETTKGSSSWSKFLSSEKTPYFNSKLSKSERDSTISSSKASAGSKRRCDDGTDQESPREDDEPFTQNSSLSPNSSPSPPNFGGGTSDSSSSTGSSTHRHHHSWKKRYCEVTQGAYSENTSCDSKKKKTDSNPESDEDSGVISSESNKI